MTDLYIGVVLLLAPSLAAGLGMQRVKMGDPSIGREHWRVEGIRVLWRGEAFALHRRG